MQSYEPPAIVDPKAMQELFPALRHFTGWAFMRIAVVRSDLRLQLESLSIRGPWPSKAGADAINDLPELSRLGFPTCVYTFEDDDELTFILDESALQVMFSAAPRLRELEIISSGEISMLPVSGISCSDDAHLQFYLVRFPNGI
jgi:hypothetical protein